MKRARGHENPISTATTLVGIVAAEPPASNPMSVGVKIGIGALTAVAVGAILYAVVSPSTASAATKAPPAGGSTPGSSTPGGSGGSGTPVNVGPPPGNVTQVAGWQPAVTIAPGQSFRASTNVADALAVFFPGVAVITDHDPIPTDWPIADLATGEVVGQPGKRFRVDATYNGATPLTLPTAAAMQAKMSAAVAAGTITQGEAAQVLNAYSDLRVFASAPNAVSKLLPPGQSATPSWTPVPQGGVIPAGTEFRASFDMRGDMTAAGLQFWTEYDTDIPADWPASDTGPSRWRVQGVWSGPAAAVNLAAVAPGAMVWTATT